MGRVRCPASIAPPLAGCFREYTIQVRALGAWLYTHLASNEEHGKLMYNDILRVNSIEDHTGMSELRVSITVLPELRAQEEPLAATGAK